MSSPCAKFTPGADGGVAGGSKALRHVEVGSRQETAGQEELPHFPVPSSLAPATLLPEFSSQFSYTFSPHMIKCWVRPRPLRKG